MARDLLAWIVSLVFVSLPLVCLGMIVRSAILHRRDGQAIYVLVSFTLREDGILVDAAPGLGAWSSYAEFCPGEHVIVLPKRNSKTYPRLEHVM